MFDPKQKDELCSPILGSDTDNDNDEFLPPLSTTTSLTSQKSFSQPPERPSSKSREIVYPEEMKDQSK